MDRNTSPRVHADFTERRSASAAVLESADQIHSEGLEEACRKRGVVLTPNRRTVLERLLESGKPLGAYEVIDAIKAATGKSVAPTTVYRALDYLVEHRLVARLESRNAFVPCAANSPAGTPMFFICDSCGSSKEIGDKRLERLFSEDARSLGFKLSKRTVELQGTCAHCLAVP